MVVMVVVWRRHQYILHGRLEQALQHAAGAAVLQAFVGGQRVLGAISPTAEFAHIQCVGLFVLILEVPFEGVVAGEGASAIGTFLRFVNAAASRRGHS